MFMCDRNRQANGHLVYGISLLQLGNSRRGNSVFLITYYICVFLLVADGGFGAENGPFIEKTGPFAEAGRLFRHGG